MKHLFWLCLVLAGCTIGTSTTARPALNRPVVGPDGSFWDASDAADRGDLAALRRMFSARFLHEAILPRSTRRDPQSTQQFDDESARLLAELAPYEPTVQRMIEAYAAQLRRLTENRFVEVGRPEYEIRFRDEFDRAYGPNIAMLDVQCWPKHALEPDAKPETIRVRFVQNRQRWLLDGIEPDPLKGAFTR
ncbi:MAG: hypothetical protein HS108_05975 [Planctomycetes bacterium]|jgi:hypothetical protein|nr:hypothetical protein [Planctomycetota bacterium]MCL4730937.1 hypothetical protein [Planctomycetota bacterium]